MNGFTNYHPIILFLYYVAIISMTMFILHPVVLSVSFIGALFFYGMITSVRILWKDMRIFIVLLVLIAVTNPLFVHKGETVLFRVNNSPMTAEAFVYGVFIAMMLVAVIFWSKAFSILITSDKFMYLFGRVIPKLSLVLTMALQFISQFKKQMREVQKTQKTLGLYTSNRIKDRIYSGIRTFYSMISWSLENAVEQGDAMKAKGYGLKGRTHFSLFSWQMRDTVVLVILGLFTLGILVVQAKAGYYFQYYPSLSNWSITTFEFGKSLLIIGLVSFPSLLEIKENLQWKFAKSKI